MSEISDTSWIYVKSERTLKPLYSKSLKRDSIGKEDKNTDLVFNQFLTTIHDVVVTLRIPGTNVTCLEPPIRSDGIVGSARVVEIPLQRVRPKLLFG